MLLDAGGFLGGTVFDDTDRDGVFDVGEPGLADWTVELQPIGTTDTPELTLANPTPDEWSQFGRFVATAGDNVVVGSHYDNVSGWADGGAAYVFDGSTGELLHTLISPDPQEGDKFGRAVAGLGDDVLVGAPLDDTVSVDSGAVYLFDGESGDLLRSFPNPAFGSNDQFGRAIAAVGGNVLVGARFDDTAADNAGAAYLLDSETGEVLHTFLSPTPTDNAQFGYSVASMGENVLIGARYDETGGAGVGAVYLFDGHTGNLLQVFRNPTQRASGDPAGFGRSVAAVGDNVLVGARLDDSGVDGGGSAFLFDGATGEVLHVFTSPTPFAGEEFGFCVAGMGDGAQGGDVLVGARWDNRWDGVNEESGGAVYLFDGVTGQLLRTFANPSLGAWDAFGMSVATRGSQIVVGARDGNAAYLFDASHEASTVETDANGHYAFEEPEPGTYRVLNHGGEGFVQTLPDDGGTYTVEIDASGSVVDLDFGYVENDRPIARDDVYGMIEDGILIVSQLEGLLANDTDPDGDELTSVIVNRPRYGSLSLLADGSFTYTPDRDFCGSDGFTYRANDGLVDSNLTSVTVTVDPVNDAPVAGDNGLWTLINTPRTVEAPGLLADDSDPDGDTLTALLVDPPLGGTVVIDPDGSYTYTPNPDYAGDDRFTYRADDGTATSNVATVQVTVSIDTIGFLKDYLRISEVNYHPHSPTPAERALGLTEADAFEFIELHNTRNAMLDLRGVKLTGAVEFEFVAETIVEAGRYALLVKDRAAFEARYGTQHNVVGQYTGDMHNNGDRIVLKDPFDRTILDFSYDDAGSWPRWADGFGSTLEIVTANQDYGDGMNWRASATYGGSPMSDGDVPRSVVINEVLSHSNLPLTDTIELHNTADEPIDISGWFLSESANDFKKFRIPDGTILPVGGYVVFDEHDFNPGRWEPGSGGFALNSSDGDDIWLTAADGEGNLTQFVDHLEFGAAMRDQSFGRWPNGTGELLPMRGRTFGSPNSHPRVGSIIMSEIMYHPAAPGDVDDDLEYIELLNVTTEAIDLRHWRIRGGISFEFPNHYDSEVPVLLEPGESVLVVGFDGYDADKLEAFREFYSISDPIRMFGPFKNSLNNDGDEIRLMRPDAPVWWEPHKIPRVLVEVVVYDNEAPWPESADGENDSLHRRSIELWSNSPASWMGAMPSPGVVDFQTGNVAIAEINYHPHEPTDTERIAQPGLTSDDFEFIEIVNVAGKPVELGGCRLSGGVAFDMPEVTLATGQRAVIVSNQAAFELRYGSQINILGTFTGTLSNRGEQITLVGSLGQALFTFSYADTAPWPVRADGAGSTLELIDMWGGYSDGTNWRPSVEYGGSPGQAGLSPIGEVVINEVLIQTGHSSGDRIELYNAVGGPIDIGGWYLSNSSANPRKFRIPDDTIIEAYGYAVFESEQGELPIDGPGFALDPTSPNSVFLLTTDAAGNVMRFADQADIGATTDGESWGRWPDGHGEFYPMVTTTFNPEAGANSGPRVGPVVISELMYHPRTSGDLVRANDLEYIEIYNPTGHPVSLAGWKLSDGVAFEFGPHTRLAPREAMLVVRFNPHDPDDADLMEAFRRHYGIKPWVDIVGGYTGSLSNQGDRVRLLRAGQSPPEDPDLIPMLFEDEVIYDDEAPWPITADGFGYSLTRIDVAAWGNDVTNWTAIPPLPGMVEPRVDKLAITELNYQPYAPTAAELGVNPNFTHDDFEFIELLNVSGDMLNLAGMQFVEGVAFAFADVTLSPAQRVLIVRNPLAFRTRYDVDESVVIGHYGDDLNDLGERLTLVDGSGETIMQFTYDNEDDWPIEAAGQGSSLELLDLAGHFNDPDNWRAGSEFGGSPGVFGLGPQHDVLINEVLANSEAPSLDLIELINNTSAPIDIGGWYLSDSTADYRKFRIPDATMIPPHGYLLFDQSQFGFNLADQGGEVTLLESSEGELVRFADRVQYGSTAVGKSFGRWPNGEGEFLPLVRPTLDPDNPQQGANRPAQMADSLIVTELNYSAREGELCEFIELQNASPFPFDLTGFHLGEGILFNFNNSTVTELAPWQYVVVVNDRGGFQTRYGSDTGILVAGEFDRNLSDGGERITLTDQAGEYVFDFAYDNKEQDGWHWMANGRGATIELINPLQTPPPGADRTEFLEDSSNWRSSARLGGSPGRDGTEPPTGVVINEVLAGANAPVDGQSMVELFNGSEEPVDVGGWYLTNDIAHWNNYTIPEGTMIPGGGYLALHESQFGFTISAGGDDLHLLTRVEVGPANILVPLFVDSVRLGATDNGESLGRWPDGEGQLYPMHTPTADAENAGPRVGPLVISELHYNSAEPDGRDNLEFIEIYNPTQTTVHLDNWRIAGGIRYTFRSQTFLPAESTLVVLSFDPADPAEEDRLVNFRETYGIGPSVRLVGPYDGRLSNGGETVELICSNFTLEDQVAYDDHSPWSIQADGRGRSLNRREEDLWGNDSESWKTAAPSPGTTDLTPAKVVGRHIFYNDSSFDLGGSGADSEDDNAVAPDKQALLPGQTASSANYTNYTRGINGIMIDVVGLGDATRLDANDFEFHVGNGNDILGWTTGPEPSTIVVRPGAGIDGSDRVTLLWADNAIEKQWLQVTVKATDHTALLEDDIFYFGNAPGEAGNSSVNTIVNATDEIAARNSQHSAVDPAMIEDPYDYNRDRQVNATDQIIARENQTNPLTMLNLITAPAADQVFEQLGTKGQEAPEAQFTAVDWQSESVSVRSERSASKRRTAVERRVDMLLATDWA